MLGMMGRAILAGIVWVIGGGVLVWRGIHFWSDAYDASAGAAFAILAAAVAIGGAKGFFVLRKSAARMLMRIESRPGKRPFWDTYPVYFYPLIGAMIGLGYGIRHFFGTEGEGYMPGLVAGVYLGIGAALLVSAAPYFLAARRL